MLRVLWGLPGMWRSRLLVWSKGQHVIRNGPPKGQWFVLCVFIFTGPSFYPSIRPTIHQSSINKVPDFLYLWPRGIWLVVQRNLERHTRNISPSRTSSVLSTYAQGWDLWENRGFPSSCHLRTSKEVWHSFYAAGRAWRWGWPYLNCYQGESV